MVEKKKQSNGDSSATLKVTRLFHQDKTKPKTCYTRSVHTKET